MSVRKSAAIFAAACLAIAPLASATVYTFQDGVDGYDGTQDLIIYGGTDSKVNTGGAIGFYAGYSAKSLLRFDNLGSLSGQTVQSATVTLYTSSNSYGTLGDTHPVTLYAMNDLNVGWQQGTGTWPDPAKPGEACFDFLSYDATNPTAWPEATSVQNWTTDGVATALDTQTYPYKTDGTPITFTLPAYLVQQWVDGGANPGLIVDSSEYINGVQFQSSEFWDGTPSGRPMLTVVTTAVPEPASMALLGMLGLGLLGRRRRI